MVKTPSASEPGSGGCPSSRVAIVIPNWNGRQHLEPCLHAIFAQEFRDFVVVVVDNGSTDGSVAMVQTIFPQVHLIQNSRNRGFAIANNQAIRATSSEFVATLNNDTEAAPGWLAALVQAMEADPHMGSCASKMILSQDRDVIESVGVAVDRAGIVWNAQAGTAATGRAETAVPVFGACAGAALYQRAMLDEVGLFDEEFFAYMEDVDLAWRAQWAGWECKYVPSAVVYHVHSATGREGSYFKNRLLGRNKLWLLCKNYPFVSRYLPVLLAWDLMSVAYAIAAGRGAGAVRGRLEALAGMRRMLTKRRSALHRIADRAMISKLHPIENPLSVLHRYGHLRKAL